jgi:hypothetical protein
MESVEEENDKNVDPGNNISPEDSEDDLGEMDSTARDKKFMPLLLVTSWAWHAFGVSPRTCVRYPTASIHTTVTLYSHGCQRQANGGSD